MEEPIIAELKSSSLQLLESFGNPQFYVSLFCIGAALSVAWLMAYLIRNRVAQQFMEHPPRKIDAEFVLKPLALTGPVLAILYLSVSKPFAAQHGSPEWVEAALHLTLAYLIARIITLVIRFRPMAYFIATIIMAIAILDVTGFMQSTSTYLDAMSFQVGKVKISVLGLINGIIVLALVLWVAGVLSRTLESYLRRTSSLSYNGRELTVKFFRIFLYFVALMIGLSFMGVDLTAFAVLGGALGVGIGLGFQQLTSNFVSGITLLAEKSVRIGDLVELGTETGWVRQLNLRYMLIETLDGKELFIPNQDFASTRIINWTHSNYKARITINVTVAYGSKPQQVIDILCACAKAHPLCMTDQKPNAFLKEFADNGLNFTLNFWIGDVRDGRFAPQSDVMIAILQEFEKAGIEIPYPQRVVHMTTAKAG